MLHHADTVPARFRSAARLRGEETRERILCAALRVFAAEGYDGASTRTLARAAGVNLPAIQYYFGNKEGLYRAVIDHISETVEERIAPVMRQIGDAVSAGRTSRRRLLELLCRMMDAFVALVTDQTSPDWESRALFFARAEIEPQIALDALHRRVLRQVVEPCALLVGMLTGQPPDAEQTLLRTVALIGQVSVFCNRKAHQVLDWRELDETRVRAIQAVVREHTRAIFRKVNGAAP
jgi:TetR/AcrR family transcriptional regulator, regulator of cefoperazone and chloramphenicol sensitivity